MISFSHVYKTYPGPVHALRNVSFKIEKGEFVFLTGPSGAGKTTLFRMISAFDCPTSGEVSVAQFCVKKKNLNQVAHFRRKIGVVFQDFRLLYGQTLFDNVALPLKIRGDDPFPIKNRVNEMLDLVGLSLKKDKFPEQVSGGEQQRTAIARALIHQPGILIADEPTGNLDPDLTEDIMDLFAKANAQGTTVLIATHDHDLVRRLNHRQIKLEGGGVLEGAG